jgi:ABC-type transport system involved in cytochrome c biogenesis permease subunit
VRPPSRLGYVAAGDLLVAFIVLGVLALIGLVVVGTLWANDWDARCLFVDCVVVKETP